MDLVPPRETARHGSYHCNKQCLNSSSIASSDLSACWPRFMNLHLDNSGPSHGLKVSTEGMQGSERKVDCKWSFSSSWIVCFSLLSREGMFLTHRIYLLIKKGKCGNTDSNLWDIINQSAVGISDREKKPLNESMCIRHLPVSGAQLSLLLWSWARPWNEPFNRKCFTGNLLFH